MSKKRESPDEGLSSPTRRVVLQLSLAGTRAQNKGDSARVSSKKKRKKCTQGKTLELKGAAGKHINKGDSLMQ